MFTPLHRALAVAVYTLLTYYFTQAGVLSLMLYVLHLEQRQLSGVVAGAASGYFFYVALLSFRALKRALTAPFM